MGRSPKEEEARGPLDAGAEVWVPSHLGLCQPEGLESSHLPRLTCGFLQASSTH